MLLKRRLWPLFTAVIAGNFSDYYLKSAFISHIAFVAFASASVRNTLIILSPVLLILPFLLFPSFIASFADHYPKAKQMRWNKLFALGIMIFSAFCFFYNILGGILVSLFLIGIEMTYLGPLKFAILPYHFKDNELLKANSILNAGSFVAIFAGALAGNYSVVLPNAEKWIALVLIVGGVIGYLASWLIPFSGYGSDQAPLKFHPIRSTAALLKEVWQNRPIQKAILCNSWFWFFCTWYFSYIPLLVRDGLQGDPHILNFVLLSFMGGIWLGSMSISWLKKTHLLKACRPLLILGALGSFGVALVQYKFHNAFDLHSLIAVFVLCFIVAFAAGAYTVPLQLFIQEHADPKRLARILSGENIWDAMFMILSSSLLYFINLYHFGPIGVITTIGVLVLVSAFLIPLPKQAKT